MRGRGGGVPTRAGSPQPPAQNEGRPPGARRLQVRSLSREADCALRLLPLLTPGPPGAGAPARRALGGVQKRRDQEQGCGAWGAGPGAWGALGCAAVPGAVGLTAHGLRPAAVRAAPHTRAPLWGEGCIPPPQHPTLQDQSYPCLALHESRSSPQRYPLAIFSHYLYRDALGGILERRVQIHRLHPALAEAGSPAGRQPPRGPAEDRAGAQRPLLLSEPGRREPRF